MLFTLITIHIFLEKFSDLLFLSLNDCALNSLSGFPKLTKLIRVSFKINKHPLIVIQQLELTDNKINADALSSLAPITELQSLSLGGNPIKNFDDLKGLSKLTKLIQLDLFGCPLSEDPKYRDKVFAMFPNLQVISN